MKKRILSCLMALALVACASTPSMDNFQYQPVKAKRLTLATWQKNVKPMRKVRIYIDGNATTAGLFTKYPKLDHPVAMELAQKDSYPSIIYLGRPCYYIEQDICKPIVWEEGKYAPELIDEMKTVIEMWQKRYKFTEIEFIAYDGGAAIAMSLATRLRNVKVARIVTIGGILNTEMYALYRNDDIIRDSLNPINETYLLSSIPQIHYVGGKDTEVPLVFTQNFVNKIPNPVSTQIKRVPNATHTNWAEFKLDY